MPKAIIVTGRYHNGTSLLRALFFTFLFLLLLFRTIQAPIINRNYNSTTIRTFCLKKRDFSVGAERCEQINLAYFFVCRTKTKPQEGVEPSTFTFLRGRRPYQGNALPISPIFPSTLCDEVGKGGLSY